MLWNAAATEPFTIWKSWVSLLLIYKAGVKIQSSMNFVPRGLRSLKSQERSNEPKPQDPLKAENPFVPRATDVIHVSAEFAEATLSHDLKNTLHRPLQAAHAVAAVGATIWGVNKLVHGETWLDRVEAAASLSLAGESALAASAASLPGVGLALGLIHGSGEVIVGVADVRRGLRENSTRRVLAGSCQILTGAGALATKLVPGGALAGYSLMMVGMVGRQAAIG